jgi:deoxyribodipyrimidine photo-lyase
VRIFNPASQAEKFDPNGEYIRKWLPQLRSLPTKLLISGEIPDSQRESLGYPLRIVEHKIQQRIFKERYNQQKVE